MQTFLKLNFVTSSLHFVSPSNRKCTNDLWQPRPNFPFHPVQQSSVRKCRDNQPFLDRGLFSRHRVCHGQYESNERKSPSGENWCLSRDLNVDHKGIYKVIFPMKRSRDRSNVITITISFSFSKEVSLPSYSFFFSSSINDSNLRGFFNWKCYDSITRWEKHLALN